MCSLRRDETLTPTALPTEPLRAIQWDFPGKAWRGVFLHIVPIFTKNLSQITATFYSVATPG